MRVELRTLPVETVERDQIGTPAFAEVDLAALERELKATVRGEVRFDAGSRGMYAHDASNYRMVPLGVVVPKSVEDVVAAMAAARKFGAPVVSRGGGTAIPGQGVNVALMIDYSKYLNRLIEIDVAGKTARVQPGIVLDQLRDEAEKSHLTFGPDPATHSRCTLGGMIGNNSCGIHSVMAGRTVDNVEELDVLLYDGTRLTVGRTDEEEIQKIIDAGGRRGEIYARLRDLRNKYADLIRERYPRIPRRVSGYNLDELLPENGFNVARALVGTEGTCVTVLEATCKLVDSPPTRSLLLLGFPDIAAAGDFAAECRKYGPIGIEGLDATFLDDIRRKGMQPKHAELLPKGQAWLLVEFGGKDKDESDGKAKKLMEDMKSKPGGPTTNLLDDPKAEQYLWNLREEGLGATADIPGERPNHEGWEDTAVPVEKVGDYLRDFRKLIDKYNYRGAVYGHLGDGCIHVRLDFDLETREGIEHYRRFVQEGADLVTQYGGSLSGEHGDGQARGELLERMYGPELIAAFVEFKKIWDPDWKMNPGKVVAPYPLDTHFFTGTGYNPPHFRTHFSFRDDEYDFAKASRRCVGAGVCRRKNGGTMCPSYMVTHEEKHSTRGRARMLFEMVQGDPVKGGWKSEEVKDALDLCLSCKGCKGDCPVQVDMATYKAEFLSHYYEGKLRPRSAYAFGFIQVWSLFAALAPEFVNLVMHAPGVAAVAKWMAGVDRRREIPRFAPQTFKAWFKARKPRNVGRPRVILWGDTFNNHFHPTTAQAAVEVLESAGFQVDVPMANLCCGRPLYDYGFLDHAKAYLAQILKALKDDIEAGTPLVVLEPSCCATFRDELTNMFPHDGNAKRLAAQTYLLSEFLNKHAPDYQPPKLKRKAVVHGHCHHKSLMKMDDEEAILQKMGVEMEIPDSGCCGMAGGFGFEEGEHYDVAMKCGERVLLPKVREIAGETLIVADGFSCREQVTQGSDRVPLHLAQVMQMALKEGESGTPGPKPERAYLRQPVPASERAKTVVLLGAVAFGVGAALWGVSRKLRK